MIVKTATWEKRNLGVLAYEVKITGEEDLADIKEELNKLQCEYLVVQAPICRLDIYELFTSCGLWYAETMIMLERKIDSILVPEYRKELNNHLSLRLMTENDFAQLLVEVRNGLYKKDRISLDNHFKSGLSANRYYWWLQDEWMNGHTFYKLMHDEDYVGFLEVSDMGNGEYRTEFTGIFPQYSGNGFAMGLTTKLIEILQEKKATMSTIEISSNNTASLQAMMRYGYALRSYFNIFIRHS